MKSDSVKQLWRMPMESGLPPEGMERERLFWLMQIAGWATVGILSLYPLLRIFSPPAVGVILLLRVGSGILLTWGMRWIYRRIRWRECPWAQLAIVVLLGCMVLGTIDSLGTHLIAALFLRNRWEAPPTPELQAFVVPMGVLLRSSLLVIWSLLYFGIKLWLETAEARLQAAQSEAAARTSELQQLRAQVNPHFLFNALNSVLAEKDNADAVERITQELAAYLRFSLRPSGNFQSLGDELDALEHYLRVEKARFEEKLEFVIEADREARRVRVPVATVQPLLENAMKYGRQTGPARLRLKVSASMDAAGGTLDITVSNTGRWLEFDAERSHGIGLSSLRRRLELLLGASARLAHGSDDEWVWVTVAIPVSVKADEAESPALLEVLS